MKTSDIFQYATISLIFSAGLLVILVMILMLYIRSLKRDLSVKTSLLSECSEYRAKADNLYHLCQRQEEELEHLRALIDKRNIDY